MQNGGRGRDYVFEAWQAVWGAPANQLERGHWNEAAKHAAQSLGYTRSRDVPEAEAGEVERRARTALRLWGKRVSVTPLTVVRQWTILGNEIAAASVTPDALDAMAAQLREVGR